MCAFVAVLYLRFAVEGTGISIAPMDKRGSFDLFSDVLEDLDPLRSPIFSIWLFEAAS
jgi:hypothetical protein